VFSVLLEAGVHRDKQDLYKLNYSHPVPCIILTSSIFIRLTQQHKSSDIHLFLTYTTYFGQQSRPSSGDFTKIWNLKLIKLRKTPTL